MSIFGVTLVRVFPHSDWIRRDTSYLSVFSANAGKYGPEKTPYSETFHSVNEAIISNQWQQTVYYNCHSALGWRWYVVVATIYYQIFVKLSKSKFVNHSRKTVKTLLKTLLKISLPWVFSIDNPSFPLF